ncbi:MAG: hypothetical protein LBE10_08165, partial [Treponema sp.]|nr:hypothetical protein [Treponema sp.]
PTPHSPPPDQPAGGAYQYDVLYINPLNFTAEENMYEAMAQYGLSEENVLRIKVNKLKTILKKYKDN